MAVQRTPRTRPRSPRLRVLLAALTGAVLLAQPGLAAAGNPAPEAARPGGPAHAEPKPGDPGTTTFDVFSDIQGHIDDWDAVLTDAERAAPGSAATVINGDIVDRGYADEYAEVREVMDAHDRNQPLLTSFGNHEAYAPAWCDQQTLCQPSWPNGFVPEDLYGTYFDFAGTDKVYGERVVNGVPLIGIGPDELMWWEDPNLDDHVHIGSEQLEWFRDRVETHGRTGKPFFVFTHYPLSDTVTQSDGDAGRYHLMEEEIREILGDYPQAVLFSSHTHADIGRDWWASRVRVPGGHPDGFTAVDTGAVLNRQYIQVTTGPAGAVVRARDARGGSVINQLTVPKADRGVGRTTLTLDTPVEAAAPGRSVDVTATVARLGNGAIGGATIELDLPDGWATDADTTRSVGPVKPGQRERLTWTLRAPNAFADEAIGVVARDRAGREIARASRNVAVAAAPSGETRLSDLPLLAETNTHGPVERDRTNGGPAPADRGAITIDGTTYEHGIGMLAPASATFYSGGRCSRLTALAGLDDNIPQGSQRRPYPDGDAGDVVFVVQADGTEIYRSGVVRQGDPAVAVDAAIDGADTVRLIAEDADGTSTGDYADWGDATLTCAG
ncbi:MULTISPECIES: NPCBM/NEW2 domain-containing protein [Prauserella salsuginis group]|uniref:NPCBM/NEW2 domain-containing protein n=1 Tax=Prauserella salsuginis TaxID=387889 RepID=A0ABW6G990_9PSEU|nr:MULTISPECIES: NPCBM/NEW2 domain-containing protein [Prauserella salsuginis group]MCR3719477.1 3',5'-cyclic AMP phosphodiesterase CpdA [Prauserella flava]MCR3735509.1 3',5'-cyclic AMP phosphodiesterase CpdA [Prauserella salsuginis]